MSKEAVDLKLKANMLQREAEKQVFDIKNKASSYYQNI